MTYPTTPVSEDNTDKTYLFIDHDVLGNSDIGGDNITSIGKIITRKFFCNNFDIAENISISGSGVIAGDLQVKSTLTVDEGVVFNSGLVVSEPIVGNLDGNATCATSVATSGQGCDYIFDVYFKSGPEKGKSIKIHTIDEMYEFIKKYHHLPTIVGREEYEKHQTIKIIDIINQLWQTVEVQSLYVHELHEKIINLEKRLN